MLSVFTSVSKLILGWVLVVLGIAGLFLPILQGALFLLLGITLLSSESRWVRKKLLSLHKRFPRQVARIRALRLKIHTTLRKLRRSAN